MPLVWTCLPKKLPQQAWAVQVLFASTMRRRFAARSLTLVVLAKSESREELGWS